MHKLFFRQNWTCLERTSQVEQRARKNATAASLASHGISLLCELRGLRTWKLPTLHNNDNIIAIFDGFSHWLCRWSQKWRQKYVTTLDSYTGTFFLCKFLKWYCRLFRYLINVERKKFCSKVSKTCSIGCDKMIKFMLIIKLYFINI